MQGGGGGLSASDGASSFDEQQLRTCTGTVTLDDIEEEPSLMAGRLSVTSMVLLLEDTFGRWCSRNSSVTG